VLWARYLILIKSALLSAVGLRKLMEQPRHALNLTAVAKLNALHKGNWQGEKSSKVASLNHAQHDVPNLTGQQWERAIFVSQSSKFPTVH
jgi:hypothetical protein